MTKLEELKAAIVAKGLRYVGTRGNLGGPICLVGEAPGADEDKEGVPFVGASGRELDRLVAEAGIRAADCWWTNPYKVRPPDNKLDQLGKLGIPLTLYEEQFYEELKQYKPRFIAALGATPLGVLCPQLVNKRTGRAEITKWRGSLLRSPQLSWDHYVIPSFHPSFLFRAWDERQNAVLCLARLQEEFEYWRRTGTLQPLPARTLVSEPAADDAIDFLRRILASPADTVVSIDIENIGVYRGKYKTKQRNRIPYVVGFSIDPLYSMSIGLGDYDICKATVIWKLVDEVLRTKVQVGQNYYTHDLPWLSYIGFSPNVSLCHDTLVRHHVLWPELSHKLDYQTFQYTREPYYKDEGKNWTVKEKARMKAYNCKDVCVTLEIYKAQEKEFAEREQAA